MPSKLSYKDVKEVIESKGCKLLSQTYENCSTPLTILFRCGHSGERDFSHFKLTEPLCFYCGTKAYHPGDIINILGTNGYYLISKNYGAKHRIEIEDDEGYRHSVYFRDFFGTVVKNNSRLLRFIEINPYLDYNFRLFLKQNAPDMHIFADTILKSCSAKTSFYDDNGYKYSVTPSSLKAQIFNKSRPSKFDSRNPYSIENISVFLKINNRSIALLPNQQYVKITKTLKFKCLVCPADENYFEKPIIKITSDNEGCPYCSGKKVGKYNNLEFCSKEIAQEWDYQKNNLTPSEVSDGSPNKAWWICPRCNEGYFSQIYKRTHEGRSCPRCKESHLEKKITNILKSYNIEFVPEKRFSDCRDLLPLPFDFYLMEYNLLCEAQGKQHYGAYKLFGGEKQFHIQKNHDNIKKAYCGDNNIRLLEIPYWEFDNIEAILIKELNLPRKEV